MTTNFSDELKFALELCDEIDQYTLSSFEKREFSVMTKADLSPVTEIDQETEKRIRIAIEEAFPQDGIEGEEHGIDKKASSRNWVVDPIDGTKNFLRGVPIWGTLIALCVEDQPVMGVVSAPSLHRRWWASTGEGSYLNNKQIHVSKVDDLEQAQASFGNMSHFEPAGFHGGLDRLNSRIYRARGIGDFWSHMLVAEGALECGLDPVVEPYDIAPLKIIVEEAGGRFTSFHGENTIRGGSGISTNGILHDKLREIVIGEES
jgi:histidinol-phosphatase